MSETNETKEMTTLEAARFLGETAANDPVVVRYRVAKLVYENDPALQSALAEYQTQRAALGREYAKDTAMQDAALCEALQARIDALGKQITEAKAYRDYTEAGAAVNELMAKVNAAISEYAFGETPCTHDCSTCHADCASKNK